jgi:glycosyltransferase involved in cell wall biosynthesis
LTSVFYLFRDSPQRRGGLALGGGAPPRFAAYGVEALAERGWSVRHNLESAAPGRTAAVAGAAVKRGVEAAGGYGGDFPTVLASLQEANRADVILSTVDTVGIPLMLLARARVVRTPFVYVAIGLPERLARLRSVRVETAYAKALARASSVVAYSEHEAESLRRWLRERGADVPVVFIPFGVDIDAFRPGNTSAGLDVVSVGADPHRDFELLLAVARSLPDARFLVVASAENARSLGERPPNVSVEIDLPFDEMRNRLGRARVVALPVRDNSYSGATTVLLQAMALAKPIVVTRTSAIAAGYGLVDGEDVRLAAPGDATTFGAAVADLLADEGRATRLGEHARRTVETSLSWDRYVGELADLVTAAAGR